MWSWDGPDRVTAVVLSYEVQGNVLDTPPNSEKIQFLEVKHRGRSGFVRTRNP